MSSKEPTIAISAHQNDIHEADLAEASQLIASLQIEDADETNEVFEQPVEVPDAAVQQTNAKPKTAKTKTKSVKPKVVPVEIAKASEVEALDDVAFEDSQKVDLVELTEVNEPVEVDNRVKFSDFNLPAEICSALLTSGYEYPTAIQAATIPAMLEGRDVLGQAQTGTGKTAAFALPLLSRINIQNPATQVLVLAPTRELAIQVSEFFQRYAQHMRGLRVAPIYGGQAYSNPCATTRSACGGGHAGTRDGSYA